MSANYLKIIKDNQETLDSSLKTQSRTNFFKVQRPHYSQTIQPKDQVKKP